MNKSELIKKAAEGTGLKKSDVSLCLDEIINIIGEELQSGGKVMITGLGTFYLREYKERNGSNPRTQERVVLKATKRPAFNPGNAFAARVAECGEKENEA